MSDTTPALDEAFERMAAASFELPNGFVNHGAMACEALAMLDCAGDIDSWARRFARAGGASVDPVTPAGLSGGSARRLPPAPGVDRLLHAGHRRRWLAGGGRGVGAAADARACHRAVPRRHPDRPRRAGHRRGRHTAAARRAGPGAGLLGGPLPRRAARPARCRPPGTCGWRSYGPRPTAPAATWPGRRSRRGPRPRAGAAAGTAAREDLPSPAPLQRSAIPLGIPIICENAAPGAGVLKIHKSRSAA